MKLTKERVTILILAVLLLATGVAAAWFCLYTKFNYPKTKKDWEAREAELYAKTESETVYRDGLWVKDLVYLTDFEVDAENGRLRFVLKNKSSSLCDCREFYLIQRKEGGEWVYTPSALLELEKPREEISFMMRGFSSTDCSCAFPVEEQTPGEYRLLQVQSRETQERPGVYAVGYFTIPG